MTTRPDFILTCAEMAEAILTNPAYSKGIGYVVSLGAEGGARPQGFPKARCKNLRLEFDDIEQASNLAGYTGCTRAHIEQLIAFAETVRSKPRRVLVHCGAGISRSSAATYIMLSVLEGPGSEVAMAEHLEVVRAWSTKHGFRTSDYGIGPNRRMVWMADKLLAREGALLAAIEQVFASRYRSPFEPSEAF